jgi:hypothetical protein
MGAVLPFDPAAIDYSALPDIDSARLPQTYRAVQTALAECQRVDECQSWADKAAAMASYARMSKDTALEDMCKRIRARAIRRCGELLQQVQSASGLTGKSVGTPTSSDDGVPIGRGKAAAEAGISPEQQRNAVRIARVPADEFERQVESDSPPTITALAQQGTRHYSKPEPAPHDHLAGRSVAEFQEGGKLIGLIDHINARAEEIDLELAFRGLSERERKYIEGSIPKTFEWINVVIFKGKIDV